jgi:hypothetical protein
LGFPLRCCGPVFVSGLDAGRRTQAGKCFQCSFYQGPRYRGLRSCPGSEVWTELWHSDFHAIPGAPGFRAHPVCWYTFQVYLGGSLGPGYLDTPGLHNFLWVSEFHTAPVNSILLRSGSWMTGRPRSRPLGVDSGPGEGGSVGVRGAPEIYTQYSFYSRPDVHHVYLGPGCVRVAGLSSVPGPWGPGPNRPEWQPATHRGCVSIFLTRFSSPPPLPPSAAPLPIPWKRGWGRGLGGVVGPTKVLQIFKQPKYSHALMFLTQFS